MNSNSGHSKDSAATNELIDRYCCGIISAEEFAALEAILESDADARAEFRRQMRVHSSLYEIADSVTSSNEEFAPLQSSIKNYSQPEINYAGERKFLLSAIAVLSIVVGVGMIWLWQGRNSANLVERNGIEAPSVSHEKPLITPEPDERTIVSEKFTAVSIPSNPNVVKNPVAILQSLVNVVWGTNSTAHRPGDSIGAGQIKIDAGVVEIVFLSGASVIIEGPATLDLKTAFKGVLHNGKVRIHVPPQARGFVIETSKAQYVDLGTEFAVEVKDNGNQELHVFDGEVEVRPRADNLSKRLIKSGTGLSVNPESLWESIKSEPGRFTDSKLVSQMVAQSAADSFNRWKRSREFVRSHPALIVHYEFEFDADRPQTLINLQDKKTHGAIIGCRWTEGRWAGKKALEFKRPNDRVRLDIPGEFDSLTLTTWMRLDGFDRHFNSIMLTDQFEDGDVHWQVKSDGTIDLGIKPKDDLRLLFLTPHRMLHYDDLGRWFYLATVIDRPRNLVTHYLDGIPVYHEKLSTGNDSVREPVIEPFKLRIGKAELGNWSPKRPKNPEWVLRNLNGCIDEFSIYATALSADEIQTLFQLGKQ
ncbi:LamG-like jellyroll fold domain-containing protein [Gimesia aquarii]|uniref:FecR protein n=1 Tax=Gimesia aquarii TaxID=2527964 RepID=A0A517X1J5_9PLAN|nr:LamG-like jellyroll fold domain-containing protein [Gimesia aquarii]QDU11377.1 FecR protein [Gimesia aquarii]